MRRAETMAWAALAGLLAIAAILLAGGVMYDTTPFWAGMMVALGQALVVGLAGYGLRLARQAAELDEIPLSTSDRPASGFRMSAEESTYSDPRGSAAGRLGGAVAGNVVGHLVGGHLGGAIGSMVGRHIGGQAGAGREVKTIDTGFQRLLVIITSVTLIGLSVVIAWFLIKPTVNWASANPDKMFPIAGSFDKPLVIDELGLVIGLSAAAIYAVLYWVTRVTRSTVGYGEAVNSNFTIGVSGMIAMGIATLLGYLRVAYAAEIAGGLMAALMLLQGLELFVNGLRSYSAIDELDQEAIDLQALPLIPMLSSFWLNSLKMLFAQSFGLSRTDGETGVIGRMMPRAIAAIIVIAIGVSCIRVVGPGEVAVLERLGFAEMSKGADGKLAIAPESLLQPGMHLTFPWPIDNLQRIPTGSLQTAHVGVELHEMPGVPELPFQFWTIPASEPTTEQQIQTQFITGDAGSPQMVEVYVAILWRVGDPSKFYNHLSHSDFFQKSAEGTQALPVFDELVQQTASFAVTRAIAIHTLDQVMLVDRQEVEQHCRQILQAKLDDVDSGIVIEDLTIKDLHPPRGHDVQDASAPGGRRLGPAAQFEDVVSQREWMDTYRNAAEGEKVKITEGAKGDAVTAVNRAYQYNYMRVGTAQSEAAQLNSMMAGRESLSPGGKEFLEKLAKMQTKYRSLKDALAPVNKIVVDPKVGDVQLYQSGANPLTPRPPGE